MTAGNCLENRNDDSILVPKMANQNIPGKRSKNGSIRKRIGQEFLYIHL